MGRKLLFLALGLGFVLGCRLLLYAWTPERPSDFDFLYHAAARLIRGENPYPVGAPRFPYPLPAVLLAAPFTLIPLALARPILDVLVGWALVYALWRVRGWYALLALFSGAYLFALARGQTTPLMVAASLIPALAFLLAVRPNASVALWIARPSWIGVIGVSAFVALSLAVRPSWPGEWWAALPANLAGLMPPLLRPFGFLLLLAGLRWRTPEARLILAMACVPQTALPYELVPLALIPASPLEMGIYAAGTWVVAAGAAGALPLGHGLADWTVRGWPVALCAGYLPMLLLVLRRRGQSTPKVEKERRRPRRIPDEELEIDVNLDGDGAVLVTVIHLPTRLAATESGPTREAAERKAQDRLAAMLAGKRIG